MSFSYSLTLVYTQIGEKFVRYLLELIEKKKAVDPLKNINKMYKILKNKDKITDPSIKDLLCDVSIEKFNITKKDPEYEKKAIQLVFDIGCSLYFCVKDKGIIDHVILDRLDKLRRCEDLFRRKGYQSYIFRRIARVTYNSEVVGTVTMMWVRNQFPTLKIKIKDPDHEEQVKRYGIPVELALYLTIDKGRPRFEKIVPAPYNSTTLELFNKFTDETLRGL